MGSPRCCVWMGSEDGAVAVDVRPAGRRRGALGGDAPAGGPGAAFEHAAERKRLRRRRRALRARASAMRSSAITVSARHSTTAGSSHRERCPMQDAGSRGTSTPSVEQQSAVAVFGQAGQAVQPGDRKPGFLQRLEQRIGQPLRELVERRPNPARSAGRGERAAGCAPAVAQRHAVQRAAATATPGPARAAASPGAIRRRHAARARCAARCRSRLPVARAARTPQASPPSPSPRRRSSAARPSSPTSGLIR